MHMHICTYTDTCGSSVCFPWGTCEHELDFDPGAGEAHHGARHEAEPVVQHVLCHMPEAQVLLAGACMQQ